MIKRSRSTLQLLYQLCMKMANPATTTRKRGLLSKFQQTVPVPLNLHYQIGPYKPCFTVTVRQLLNYMSNTINYNNRYTIYSIHHTAVHFIRFSCNELIDQKQNENVEKLEIPIFLQWNRCFKFKNNVGNCIILH